MSESPAAAVDTEAMVADDARAARALLAAVFAHYGWTVRDAGKTLEVVREGAVAPPPVELAVAPAPVEPASPIDDDADAEDEIPSEREDGGPDEEPDDDEGDVAEATNDEAVARELERAAHDLVETPALSPAAGQGEPATASTEPAASVAIEPATPEPATDDERRKAAGLELERRFARSRLEFVFDAHDARAGLDLVAPGGHVLRTLEDLFAKRGRRTYVTLPATKRLTKELLAEPLGPSKGHTLTIDEREDLALEDVLVGFRTRFRGREHKDALLWVEVSLRRGPDGEVHASSARPVPAPSPELVRSGTFHPRKHVAPGSLALAFRAAVKVLDEASRPIAAELEGRIRRRIERDASRLELFYATAIVEHQRSRTPTDLARDRILELEEERTVKRRELLEGARVTVEADALQLLQLERPAKLATVKVSRKPKKGGGEGPTAALRVSIDLTTGAVETPPCPACAKAVGDLAVDDQGHAVHAGCSATCNTCGSVSCSACGATTCARGGEPSCSRCATACEGCGDLACPEHRATCARCDASRCDRCLPRCAHCGDPACADHRHAIGDGAEAVLCAKCGAGCTGCERAVLATELARCSVCGRRYCAACLGGKRALRAEKPTCPGCR